MSKLGIIENEKVLVTGGAGFIGSNLCEVLLQQNNEVVCLDNLATGHRYNIEDFLSNSKFTFIEGDIRNFEDCKKAVKGCKYVFHQAALGSVPRSIKNPMLSTEVNVSGFVNMLYASAEEKVVRFVYAASSSTYGDSEALPKIEHRIGKALSPYAITKYVNELHADNFSKLYGIDVVGLRYFNVFGRRQDPNGAYAAVIPKFMSRLIKGESPLINGDGSFSRDFTYIDNVLQANQKAAVTPKNEVLEHLKRYNEEQGVSMNFEGNLNTVVNVAYGKRTTLLELVGYLKEVLKEFTPSVKNVEIEFGPNREGDIPHSLASVQKATDLFNYNPEYSVYKGLKESANWYWENLKKN